MPSNTPIPSNSPVPDTSSSDTTSPDKLSLIVFSGTYDKVHYALATAAAAAAIDKPVTLFFTMDACRALGSDQGWRELPTEAAVTPTADGPSDAETATERDAAYAARGVAAFEVLLTSCAELGVRFMVCEMGLRARGLEGVTFRDDVTLEEGGLVTFLSDASKDGVMLFI